MSQQGKQDNDTLEHAIEAFGEAWARGDVATLDAMLSPTYTHNDAFGQRHDKAEWLAYAGKRAGRSTRIEFRGVATRIFGDIAIVTGFNDITGGGAVAENDSRDLTIAFTQVLRRENGRWLREAFQGTPVVPDVAS